MTELETQRKHIAARVRELRRSRRWTQAELATQLELSQSRLSEIETGRGSFTAEQLLRVLALFNVGVEELVVRRNDPQHELQNALARFGAKHLLESDRVVPTERLSELSDVIRDALLDGSPRLVTAVAPVLVAHARELRLGLLYSELERLGSGSRLGWVVENTLAALDKLAVGRDGRTWEKLRFEAMLPLQTLLSYARDIEGPTSRRPIADVLDATIRTEASREGVRRASSKLSRKWGIVTSLRVDDFVEALRAAR